MEAVARLEQTERWAEPPAAPSAALEPLLAGARSLAETAPDVVRRLDLEGSALFASRVEELSRTVEYLQVLAAGQLDRVRAAELPRAASGTGTGAPAGWLTGWADNRLGITGAEGANSASADSVGAGLAPAVPESGLAAFAGEFRNTSDYLRVLLRIGRGEARRRLALAETVLPRIGISGQDIPPTREHLATAAASGTLSARAATIITLALDKAPSAMPAGKVQLLEENLVGAALENDPDFLSRLAQRWLEGLDPDGTEPSEEELRRVQGAFIRKPKNGLNHLEIFATQHQYETLLTAMNAATNPRTGVEGAPANVGTTNDDPTAPLDRRSRPQKLLDGLIGACTAGLTTAMLPIAGGHRPQIVATINYQDLFNEVQAAGTFTFTGPVPAAALRKLACDADIIPVVLGDEGQILDIGRASRLFPPLLRKAIAARDQGCAFPSCSIPAPWCEAHHISYWSHGGSTSADNGTLLCSHHHHVIHKEQWKIEVRTGIPWFIPPPWIDPQQQPRRNHYFRC